MSINELALLWSDRQAVANLYVEHRNALKRIEELETQVAVQTAPVLRAMEEQLAEARTEADRQRSRAERAFWMLDDRDGRKTAERLERLEAVVEAARPFATSFTLPTYHGVTELRRALARLDGTATDGSTKP